MNQITFRDGQGSPDERAFFEALYRRYHRLMLSVASRYTSSQSDLEDIVQDSSEKLLYRLPKLMELPRYALPTYIVYTVRSTAINFRRHQAVVDAHTPGMDILKQDAYESDFLSPQEVLERKELGKRFAAIWPLLPEQDRELLYRKYILEQPDAELAEIFQCQKDSVRMKLTRARRKALALAERGEQLDKT